VSNYCLENSVLNFDYLLKNLNKQNSANTIKAVGNKNTGDSFYSVLIQHQLELIRAWNTEEQSSGLGFDSFSFSQSLLQLKDYGLESKFSPTLNMQQVLKSYETSKTVENTDNLNKLSLQKLSVRIATKNSIPSTMFQKLIQIESGYDSKALSPRGAMGLGQIMPETAKELGLTLGDDDTRGSVWNAESNLDASARYLKKLYDKYQKEGISEKEAWSFAVGAYNAGMGNIAKAINKVSQGPVRNWDQVAQVLPQVTGKYSQETIRYVNRLRA
jgi:soluble lytic murein transglycosylase-like protein